MESFLYGPKNKMKASLNLKLWSYHVNGAPLTKEHLKLLTSRSVVRKI